MTSHDHTDIPQSVQSGAWRKPWLCHELRVVTVNLHRSDLEISALLPGRSENAIKQTRRRYALWKPVPRDRAEWNWTRDGRE